LISASYTQGTNQMTADEAAMSATTAQSTIPTSRINVPLLLISAPDYSGKSARVVPHSPRFVTGFPPSRE